MSTIAGKVCLVTGASRGIGKGIASVLGREGATVYITGRTLEAKEGSLGSLKQTAKEIDAAGGKGIPIQCDHANDDEISRVFETISKDQNGQLDVLVNNAYAGVQAIFDTENKKFWEMPDDMWDTINGVGLRAHYIATCHAARLMIPRKQGLIVNVSSAAGMQYFLNAPYGIGKAAMDRMAADCGHELKSSNVAVISLWPGVVKTEMNHENLSKSNELKAVFSTGEDPTLSGKAVAALAKDPKVMKKSGRVATTADLSAAYGFTDITGKAPLNFRSIQGLLTLLGSRLAPFAPSWIKIPWWIIAIATNKF